MLGVVLTSVLFVKFAWLAFVQTGFGIWDQTHYFWTAVKELVMALIRVVHKYLTAAPRLFIAHFKHNVYLNKLGLDGVENLKDNGSLVAMHSHSNNKVNSKATTRVTGLKNNSSGNVDHMSISSSAILKLWEVLRDVNGFRFTDSVFLDFGCGTGFALISAMTQHFRAVVGVELDENTVKLAENNIQAFRSAHAVPVACKDDTVVHEDMSTFNFSSLSKDAHTIVLHLYEPLWTVPKNAAHDIYLRTLRHARAQVPAGKRVIVAYFHAGWFNGDALPALKEIDAELITKFDFDSLNFGCSSICYVYQLR